MAESKKSADAAAASWFDSLQELASKYPLPGVDLSAVAEWQRKDLEAVTEAGKVLTDGARASFERRNEILAEAVAQWQAALKDATSPDALSKGGEMARQGVEKAMANFRELTELEAKARADAWKVVQDRMQQNMAELQKLLQPKV
ncbi:MAG: TIGR01841 family phasin [Caulobacteraceae bacterium]|jgi:phasin family protein